LEVFDYIADPARLPEWVPVFSNTVTKHVAQHGRTSKGDTFMARFSLTPPAFQDMLFFRQLAMFIAIPEIKVTVDDVVHGRRLAYRANTGWTTICDFESSAGRTLFTMTQSLWSYPGLLMNYWIGPMKAIVNDMAINALEGLKGRLENRAIEFEPKVFFSYRRSDVRYVGGRIFDALTAEFGPGTVFRDSSSLLAGGDWNDDIDKAIKRCKVVVVHIGDHWEGDLLARLNTNDGLRDELEAALSEGNNIRMVPVITSNRDNFNHAERMAEIAITLEGLGDKAPHIREKFTSKLQALYLREDPDSIKISSA
jgi:hypothetical protein